MSLNRIYISNLNFNTTEDELMDFFKEFQVTSVLIPSQTVRFFRNNQVRPLGIGYAEFPTAEKAQEAINSLNGKSLKDRQLRLKPYVAYSPEKVSKKVSKSRAFSNFRRSRNEAGDVLISTSSGSNADMQAADSNSSPEAVVEGSDESSPQEVAYSNDTLFLGYLPKDVTDIEIRDYLDDYHPSEIWIFRTRPKGKHLQHLHRHFMAALVTVKTRENLDNVVASLLKKKFSGKKITVRKARLNKLKEVQRMAEAPPMEQLDIDVLPESELPVHLQNGTKANQYQQSQEAAA